MITAEMVKGLREKTGAGMMDCKKTLTETNGDVEKAIELLKEKGLAAAAKKADRVVTEGLVESYIHGGGRIGVLVEVNCETDFVSKNPEFKELCRDIAMQIAASSPLYVSRDEIPAEELDAQKVAIREEALAEGKPANILDKMVEGRLEKRLKETCLLEQSFIKNPDITVLELIKGKIAKIGENISVRHFKRYAVGEGVEKKQSNLAAEVAALRGLK